MDKESFALVIAIVSGLFTLIASFFNWQFTKHNIARQASSQFEDKHYQNRFDLYVRTYELFERMMAFQMLKLEKPSQSDFSINSAKMRLLAPKSVYEKYYDTTSLLEKWAKLDQLTKPHTTKVGDEEITFLQAPDPTEKYKKPAQEALTLLQSELTELVRLMRADIDKNLPQHASHISKKWSNQLG